MIPFQFLCSILFLNTSFELMLLIKSQIFYFFQKKMNYFLTKLTDAFRKRLLFEVAFINVSKQNYLVQLFFLYRESVQDFHTIST